jgi:adenosylhomocysteine nucleosidase
LKNPSPLICFALKEEAAPFRKTAAGKSGVAILVTGIGQKNAEKSVRDFFAAGTGAPPAFVLTCGYAGALNPQLPVGTVVFEEDVEAGLGAKLIEAGAVRGKFHCSPRVIVTAAEKWALWQKTGADAVEMESEIIRAVCREHKIPGVTLRVISDGAGEDLPLDFSAFMTADERLDYLKLVGSVAGNPRKIPELLKLRRQTVFAARKLAEALRALLCVS